MYMYSLLQQCSTIKKKAQILQVHAVQTEMVYKMTVCGFGPGLDLHRYCSASKVCLKLKYSMWLSNHIQHSLYMFSWFSFANNATNKDSNGHHTAPLNLQLQVARHTGYQEQDHMECLSKLKSSKISITDHPFKCKLHQTLNVQVVWVES